MKTFLTWCPEHTDQPEGCAVCEWLSKRTCGCPDGVFCLRCNRVVMRHELEVRR